MGSRVRKFVAEVSVANLVSCALPDPWPSLTLEEADVWRQVVQSLPADYYMASDLALLAADCQASAQCTEGPG